MRREIKFRGKSVESGELLYGSYIDRSDVGKAYIVTSKKSHIPNEVEPESVAEYTGGKDQNGKEIYEGDYLEFCYRCKRGCGKVICDGTSFLVTSDDFCKELIEILLSHKPVYVL